MGTWNQEEKAYDMGSNRLQEERWERFGDFTFLSVLVPTHTSQLLCLLTLSIPPVLQTANQCVSLKIL